MSLTAPLRFVPWLRPMVWGGRRLGDSLGKDLPTPEKYGESWDVSDHPLHRSIVAAGPMAGRSLRLLMEEENRDLLGPATQHAVFPWLVKFLDAADWLSVQVHPDEAAVRRLWPGEGSKTEAWFVLDAAPESRIYAGLRPGIGEKELRELLATGRVAEALHSFAPQTGDCLFLPAGTVHAVGGGVLMAEVQQTSDATFRLFDWNRRDAQGKSRQLHIEESLASIHWQQGPVEPIRLGDCSEEVDEQRRELVRCPYFVLEHVCGRQPLTVGETGRLQLLIILQGRGRWTGNGSDEAVGPAQAWMLPAAMRRAQFQPESSFAALLCTLP